MMRFAFLALLLSCSGPRLGVDLDLRWQSCAGTLALDVGPGATAAVETATATCDGVTLAEAVCPSGRLTLAYSTLPEGRYLVQVACDGVPVLTLDGHP